MLLLLALLSMQPPALRGLLQLRAAVCLHLPCALQQPILLLLILHRWANGVFTTMHALHLLGAAGAARSGASRTPSRSCKMLGVESNASGIC